MLRVAHMARDAWVHKVKGGVLVQYISYRRGVMRVELCPPGKCRRGELRDYPGVEPETFHRLVISANIDRLFHTHFRDRPYKVLRQAK